MDTQNERGPQKGKASPKMLRNLPTCSLNLRPRKTYTKTRRRNKEDDSEPTSRFQITDRGLVKPGMHADLVIFNEEEVRDTATYEDPHRYPEGIYHVIVNGVPVIRNGKHTNATPGKLLSPLYCY